MSYKLAIASILFFAVELRIQDEGRTRTFKFELQAERLTQDQLTEELETHKDRPVAELLKLHVTGWRHQQLVLDEATNQPAEFSPAAFDSMLTVPGAAGVIFSAYVQACGAKGKLGN